MTRSRENFVRLAEARTKRALKHLDLLGNLSNRSNYTYSEDDVKRIFKALSQKLQAVETRFRLNLKSKEDEGFKL